MKVPREPMCRNGRSTVNDIENNETTPLLIAGGSRRQTIISNSPDSSNSFLRSDFTQSNSKCCEVLGILGILIIFVSGFMIGIYLLARDENLFSSDGMILDMMGRNVWSNNPKIVLANILNDYQVLYVVLLQGVGRSCNHIYSCIRILTDLETERSMSQQDDIPYNFLIGGDERTYEVRGWNFESGFNFLPPQNLFVIGFIGNYTHKTPTERQEKSALSLINELDKRKKLHQSYQVFGIRNLSISPIDGASLFNRIVNWKHYSTVLNVL